MSNDIYINVKSAVTDIAYVRNNWNLYYGYERDYDLGWYITGSTDFDYFKIGTSPILDINDTTQLLTLNVFGNYNRVTNNSGGTDYTGTGGTIADYAIDHFTGIGWYLQDATAGGLHWSAATDEVRALTAATFSDWRLPTVRDAESIALGDGNNDNIFSDIESWGSISWLMNSVSASNIIIWRLNAEITSTHFQSFSPVPNGAISTISVRNHYAG